MGYDEGGFGSGEDDRAEASTAKRGGGAPEAEMTGGSGGGEGGEAEVAVGGRAGVRVTAVSTEEGSTSQPS